MWDDIRRVFAGTKQARQRGYGTGRFSFNTKGGRCEECEGQGVRRIAMNFLPDLEVTCPVCHGARFNRQTLAVRYRDRSIADVLAMSIDEAVEFFENHESIRRVLATLADVGLGYLTLGQPSTTLSGGEAQRIKLATELGRAGAGHTLYILDEPTTGLHSDDIRRLLAVLNRLVDQGQLGARDRAQSGRHQDGRLGDRPRPGRRRGRRPGRGGRHAGGDCGRCEKVTRGSICGQFCDVVAAKRD